MALRFQIVAPVLLVGIVGVGGSLYFAQQRRARLNPPAPVPTVAVAAPDSFSAPPDPALESAAPPTPTFPSAAAFPAAHLANPAVAPALAAPAAAPGTNAPTAAERQTRIRAQINQLRELAMEAEAESLEKITAALTDPEPAIRAEAIDAAVQFGSRDAITALQELAARSPDAREKVAALEAIEFLETPSLTELRTKLRARRAAWGTNAAGGVPPP